MMLLMVAILINGVASTVALSHKRRATMDEVIPAPIAVPPSQYFEGIDGSWSTFNLRIGTSQSVRAIASTNSPITIVVQPGGCEIGANPRGIPTNCAFSRGGTFNKNLSATWHDQGWFNLNGGNGFGFEANLGYNFNLNYGLDTLGVGFQEGIDSPSLKNQTVAAYNLPSPCYLGLLGLGTQPVIYETFGNYSVPSYFQSLRSAKKIPSLSWSYTAGASYRLAFGQYSQLIFGGFDTSRFQPNDVKFSLSEDVTRDIVVGLQSIVYSGTSTKPLLPTPIYAFVESTDPNIWLPLEACKEFEAAFGLEWDDITSKYLINDTQFTTLSQSNPTVTFRLAASTTGGASADIVLPFQAFGLKAAYPFVPNATHYFPLQRAENATQYTLGRAFLQEGYLTVDYERRNFSLCQNVWLQGATPKISTIVSPEYSNKTPSHPEAAQQNEVKKNLTSAIVGGVIGFLVFIGIGVAGIWHWKTQKKQAKERKEAGSEEEKAAEQVTEFSQSGSVGPFEVDAHYIPEAPGIPLFPEMHGSEQYIPVELQGSSIEETVSSPTESSNVRSYPVSPLTPRDRPAANFP